MSAAPPDAGWPTEAETGIRLAQAGVVLTVSTPDGEIEDLIILAWGGSAVVASQRPGLSTDDLLALDGACVIISYPAPDTDPARPDPWVIALAAGPTAPPMALDPFNDVVVAGYANPEALVTALRGEP